MVWRGQQRGIRKELTSVRFPPKTLRKYKSLGRVKASSSLPQDGDVLECNWSGSCLPLLPQGHPRAEAGLREGQMPHLEELPHLYGGDKDFWKQPM